MPFSIYDPQGEALLLFRQAKCDVVVLLAEQEECLERAGRNLKSLYAQEGFHVVHLPIADFSVPSREGIEKAAMQIVEHARSGQNIVIHCHAGLGRTGLFVAYLAKLILGLPNEEAIQWTRKHIPHALETDEQIEWILEIEERGQTSLCGRA